MRIRLKVVSAAMLMSLMIVACSDSGDKEETSSVKINTEIIAQKGVDAIKTPLEQATLAREMTQKHNETIEKAVDNQ